MAKTFAMKCELALKGYSLYIGEDKYKSTRCLCKDNWYALKDSEDIEITLPIILKTVSLGDIVSVQKLRGKKKERYVHTIELYNDIDMPRTILLLKPF